jgi:hypothetical protein
MAVFNCPQCGHAQAVDDKYLGMAATCPKCKAQNKVQQGVQTPPLSPTPPAEDQQRRVIHKTSGHLGIRCDSWMDAERHINKASSLRIEWITIIDDTMPVIFFKPCGLIVHNRSSDYPLSLVYEAETKVQCCGEPITAFEVKYLTFNVWAEHVSTLVAEEVVDGDAGKHISRSHTWHLFSETEAEAFCASVAFVSRVRMASGAIRCADTTFVLREAQRFTEKFTEADLDPKAPKKE